MDTQGNWLYNKLGLWMCILHHDFGREREVNFDLTRVAYWRCNGINCGGVWRKFKQTQLLLLLCRSLHLGRISRFTELIICGCKIYCNCFIYQPFYLSDTKKFIKYFSNLTDHGYPKSGFKRQVKQEFSSLFFCQIFWPISWFFNIL